MVSIERSATVYTKYEKARLIGARALQISQGAPLRIKLSDDELLALKYNPIRIAKRELEANVLPIDVKRGVAKIEE